MEDYRTVAWMLIAGAVLFLAAAFNPSSAVFTQADPGAKLNIIQDRRTLWNISQVLFGAGAAVTALAVLVLAVRWLDTSAGIPLLVGGAAMVVGAVLWDIHVYQRAVNPVGFVEGELSAWLFSAYTLLTLFGLLILGLSFIQVGLPAWLGYGTAVAAILLTVAYFVFNDMPPFIYYVITLISAFVLL
ncbi:MAG: hypothetical protein R3191_06000 [Anaerolineales bacterium]|nr:hypothetical protein [Anaerolineales bacterium]